VVDGKGKEEDLLVDEVFKYSNVGSIASDRKLRSLCLVMLGSSGCRGLWWMHHWKEAELGS
jgi:hypothetical protein